MDFSFFIDADILFLAELKASERLQVMLFQQQLLPHQMNRYNHRHKIFVLPLLIVLKECGFDF